MKKAASITTKVNTKTNKFELLGLVCTVVSNPAAETSLLRNIKVNKYTVPLFIINL